MADQVQIRGGSTSQNDDFTGAPRELSVDVTKHTIRVHDGATQGGFELARADQVISLDGGGNVTGDIDITGELSVTGDAAVTGDVEVTGDIQSTSQNGGPLAGFRNQIINGDFRIIQRLSGYNATRTVTLNVTNFFADRWAYLSAASGTCRVNTSLTFPNYTIRQGANVSGLRQPIELPATGACGPFVIGSTWTISVWCNTDLTSADFNGPSLIFNTGNAGTTNPVTAAASVDWASTGETINGFTRYYSTQTINASPGADSTCLEFILQKKNDGVNLAFDWAHAQLEPGPVATPFEQRPYGTELALCQRYYQTSIDRSWDDTSSSLSKSALFTFIPTQVADTQVMRFPTSMRALPTVTVKNVNHQDGQARRTGGSTENTALTVTNRSVSAFTFTTDVTSIRTFGFAYKLDAEL